MLLAAIQEAIDLGIPIDIFANGDTFSGVPMLVDNSFLSIVCINTEFKPARSANWIVRLSSIDGCCVSQIEWGESDDDEDDEDDDDTLDDDTLDGDDDDDGDVLAIVG